MPKTKWDFSGYATKNDLKCTDGRTIRRDAFKENDGQIVPLVWQHMHNEPANVLGHALLENRPDGMYAYAKLNDTDAAKNAEKLVKHRDIVAFSIYANQLKQQGDNVIHGMIREVSLVLTGANPGALIDNISFAHGDGTYDTDEEEAIIYTGLNLQFEDEVKHSDEGGKKMAKEEKTVEDVFNELTDEQKDVVYTIIGAALEEADDEEYDEEDVEHSGGGKPMKKNVFDGSATGKDEEIDALMHADFPKIAAKAKADGGSLKEAFLAHAGTYGIDNIGYLFPDAQNVTDTPTWVSRNMAWVGKVLSGTKHSPFSRIKTQHADITADEARAKGYVTGALKKEEVFSLLKRTTSPTTIYKKQKLDRDDIVDITDMDVVAWIKMEMRVMLNEEIARAILVSDGRAVDSEDKIQEANIRPIWKDDDFYAHKIAVANDILAEDLVDEIIKSREFYKGSGSPTLFTTTANLLSMLLLKDKMGRRLYATVAELANILLVDEIVEVPVMENLTRVRASDSKVMTLVGIIVNLKDYTVGADKGGSVNMFDDFDIDYNQYKYLMETRISGALTLPKSAIIIEKLPAVEGGE